MPFAGAAAALALCFAGLSGLCLAMGRHQQQVLQRTLSPAMSRTMRISGWLLLALSVVACVRTLGGSVGVVAWTGLLSLIAVVVVLTLSYAPRLLLRCAVAAVVLGMPLLGFSI